MRSRTGADEDRRKERVGEVASSKLRRQQRIAEGKGAGGDDDRVRLGAVAENDADPVANVRVSGVCAVAPECDRVAVQRCEGARR
jgi:hypothetical protein